MKRSVFLRRLFLSTSVFFVLSILAARANAFQLRVLDTPLRIDITESLFTSYHGDLGYLITETDRNGKTTDNYSFWDILNRLNVDLAWGHWRLATRFDSAVYFGAPDGSCGPAKTTRQPINSRFCENYFYLEKISLEYTGRNVEATLGDFYVSFGRGLVLSVRKLDELGIDTTLFGGKFVYHEGNLAATLVLGATNIQNIDEATGRYANDGSDNSPAGWAKRILGGDNPYDMIGGARLEYRFADKVIVGLHEAGGIMTRNTTSTQHEPNSMFNYGGSIDAPRLTRWLGLYVEAAGQSLSSADQRQTGYAIYGAATGYFGPTSVLLEFKHYSTFHRWGTSVNPSFVEFAPLAYNQPPTAERVQTELTASIYDVTGPRLRVDWRINSWALVYASYAYFQDRGISSIGVLEYHDPYLGAEFRWNEGRSHLFPSGGYRIERCRDVVQSCLGVTPDDALGEFQHVGHIELDFTQVLPRNFSLELQGFAWFRRGDLVTGPIDANGKTPYPNWTEGDLYVAVKWTPYLVATLGIEGSDRPSSKVNQAFVNGAIQYNITTSSSIRFFAGGTRGGLKCISGVCRDFPPFTGAKLEVVVRL